MVIACNLFATYERVKISFEPLQSNIYRKKKNGSLQNRS